MKSSWYVRGLAAAAVMGIAGVSGAQVVFDNGAYQTHANGGPGNAPRSVLQNAVLNMETYGFGCQSSSGNRLADNFTVPASAKMKVTGFRFYAYQNGAASPTINNANVRVWGGGAPNAGGSVIAGSPTTNIFSSVVSTGVYRVDDLTGGELVNSRLITEVRANFAAPVVLNAGTFWADWQLNGTGISGPWNVPVTILGQTGKAGANGIQFLGGSTNAWSAALDFGTSTAQDLAFKVVGSWLFNPTSFQVVMGQQLGGSVASFSASDNNYFTVLLDEITSDSDLRVSSTSPSSTATSLTFVLEAAATRPDLTQFVELQNASNVFELIDTSTLSLTDTTRSTVITVNPSRFIRAANATVARIRTIPQGELSTIDGWSYRADLVEWEIVP